MDDPAQELLQDVERDLARLDYPGPKMLARLLGIRIIYGAKAGVNAGVPPVITLPWGLDVLTECRLIAHEIGHFYQRRSGLEALLRSEWTPEAYTMNSETIADHIGRMITLPTPLRLRAEKRYGLTATAVLQLQKVTGMELHHVLERVVHIDPDATRAGFVVTRGRLSELRTNNVWIEKALYDPLPEIDQFLPGASLRLIAPTQVLGVWGH